MKRQNSRNPSVRQWLRLSTSVVDACRWARILMNSQQRSGFKMFILINNSFPFPLHHTKCVGLKKKESRTDVYKTLWYCLFLINCSPFIPFFLFNTLLHKTCLFILRDCYLKRVSVTASSVNTILVAIGSEKHTNNKRR